MDNKKAMEIFERWFEHIERKKKKTKKIQQIAILAKTDYEEAQKQMRMIDTDPEMPYDADRLLPACIYAYHILRSQELRKPLRPEELVNSLHDVVHKDPGRARPVKTVRNLTNRYTLKIKK